MELPNYSALPRRSDGLTVLLAKRKKEKTILIAIDDNGEIRAEEMTDNATHDSEVVPILFSQEDAKIEAFAGDGAFDT